MKKAAGSNGATAGQVFLKYGVDNNYEEFRAFAGEVLATDFGFLAQVVKTDIPYVVPGVVAELYTPPLTDGNGNAVAPLSAAMLAKLRVDCERDRIKIIAGLTAQHPAMFSRIMGMLSPGSKQIVKNRAAFAAADTAQNPNMLWAIISATHKSSVGDDPALGELEKETIEMEFAVLRQDHEEDLGSFAERFKIAIKRRQAAGLAVFTDEAEAIKFLTRLHTKHSQMVIDMTNTKTFPVTFSDAFDAATNWKVAAKHSAGGSMMSVFMSADSVVRQPRQAPPAPSPVPKASPRAPRRGVSDSASVVSDVTTSVAAGSRKDKKRNSTCDNCGKKGHHYYECERRLTSENQARLERRVTMQSRGGTASTLVGIGEEDDADEDEGYEHYSVHMIRAENFAEQSRASDLTARVSDLSPVQENILSDPEHVFFGATDVLLDNAAGTDIFANQSLLSNVRDAERAVRIAGVQAGAPSLKITRVGVFGPFGNAIGVHAGASANILSQARLEDEGGIVQYDGQTKVYTVTKCGHTLVFARRTLPSGALSRHWVCDMKSILPFPVESVYPVTVAGQMAKYTVREVSRAKEARALVERLGGPNPAAAAEAIDHMTGTTLTSSDVRRAVDIFGPCLKALKGCTTKHKSAAAAVQLVPRIVQKQQQLQIDIIFVKGCAFLLGVLLPLHYALCEPLLKRTVGEIGNKLKFFLGVAKKRDFETPLIRCDNEGAVAAIAPDLALQGLAVDLAGPGQHVAEVERLARTVKERVRGYDAVLPFTMCRLILTYCVLFAVSGINMVAGATSTSRLSPRELFTGMRTDASRDLRVGFGDYVQCTPPTTDNSMAPRKEGGIVLLPTGNLTGSVKVLKLSTWQVVIRDQITLLPMPDQVIDHLNSYATTDAMVRGGLGDHDDGTPQADSRDIAAEVPLPAFMPIGAPAESMLPTDETPEPGAGVETTAAIVPSPIAPATPIALPETPTPVINSPQVSGVRRSLRQAGLTPDEHDRVLVLLEQDKIRAEERDPAVRSEDLHDKHLAFKISVKTAMRERGEEARPVIMAEMQQMVDKSVFHGVRMGGLSKTERRKIIRSSMFLKDKYLPSGEFEKFKARLVAGGDQQDRSLYDDVSSPTAATSSVLVAAAIAASEGRHVMVADIGGAFLNADLDPTGVTVHMSLDKLMTELLVKIDPSYAEFVLPDGTSVVKLTKALYGTVEAAKLWYDSLSAQLIADGFVKNPYDSCVYNKIGKSGKQTTIVLHVDDLLVTSESDSDLGDFELFLRAVYKEVTIKRGTVLGYLGMLFDFTTPGEVRVTMDNLMNDILSTCGVDTARATPASSVLFDTRDAQRLDVGQQAYFRKFVAKVLYMAKRVRPECLTAVAFLTTRVNVCDVDDLAKLHRLLGYLLGTRDRGIALRIGGDMTVHAYIDAAYGVHSASGKSHTGCAIVLGQGGPVYVKSGKQKIVTKSSTEAELVGLSDTASQAIQLRNFVIAQGYDTGPAIIYQDNLSCMALMKRGGPGSERSRHIDIRHFWLKERVEGKEILIQHLGTEKMFANVLTKPVQGRQFVLERKGLTNWE